MGKQTRRKRQTGKKSSPIDGAANAISTATAAAAKAVAGPAILQRIRHADPLCRHAALSAVLHTTLDPELLSSDKPKSVSAALLQAIREQVMDSHTECATLAAACLSNYAQYASDTISDEQLSAGWMLLLTGRLQQCVTELQKADTASVTAATALKASAKAMDVTQKRLLQWLQLTEQCLQCTASLLENNPVALQRLISTASAASITNADDSSLSRSPQLRNDSLGVWLQLAQLAAKAAAAASAASATSANAVVADNNSDNGAQLAAVQTQVQLQTLYQSIHLLAVRCLHSAWDDNAALLLPWMREQPVQAQECLQTLLETAVSVGSADSTVNRTATAAIRLHCAGAWLAAWSLVSFHQDEISRETVAWARPLLLETATDSSGGDVLTRVVNVLCRDGLECNVTAIRQVMEQAMAAWTGHQAQEADDALEQQVQSSTDQKKESTRLIARRMKQQKEEAAAALATANATAMQEGNDNDNMNDDNQDVLKKRGKFSEEDRQDWTAVWDQVQAEWQDLVRPIQLALEISANLTSTGSGGGGGGAGMMEEGDDDDGDDEQDDVMMDAGLDDKLTNALLQTKLPDQILQLVGKLVSPDWMGTSSNGADLPDVIRESCDELQSKAGTCLGHCLAALPDWTPPASLWTDLKLAMHKSMGKAGREGISSAMVVALQSRESIRTQMQSDDLDFLLQLLQNGDDHYSSVVVQRDAVCMLGILCSQEEHPAEVNQKTCQALLQALAPADKQSAMVLAEVLSVLMDIYGDDDCHPAVFAALDVLGHFQRSVPLLKQRISLETDAEPDDVEQWKETALNASRFIAYKKDQL